MLSFPKGGGRGALKEKQTNIDSPQSRLGLKRDEESLSPRSYPGGRAAAVGGSSLAFERQPRQGSPAPLARRFGQPVPDAPLPFGPDACLARDKPARWLALPGTQPPPPPRHHGHAHLRQKKKKPTEVKQKRWVVARSPLNSGGGRQRALISYRETCV